LLAHLIASDVRQFRLPIGAWLLTVTVVTAMTAVRSSGPDPFMVNPLVVIRELLWIVQVIFLVVLVPLIVQAHPPVGSDAFWMTRPIPASTLLAAKTLLLGLLTVAAPVAAKIVLMLFLHVPAADMAGVASEWALFYAIVLVLLMALAAVTPDLWRFALTCGSVLAAIALFMTIAIVIDMRRFDDGPPTAGGVVYGDPTSSVVGQLALVAAVFSLLIAQYRTRSRVRAIPLGVAALLLSSAVVTAWPWPFLRPIIIPPAWSRDDSTLRLSADPESVVVQGEVPFGRRALWRSARARVAVSNLPAPWSATAGVVDASLDLGSVTLTGAWSGHASAVLVGAGSIGTMPRQPSAMVVLRDLLGVDRLFGTNMLPDDSVVFFVRDADFKRHASSIGHYHGRFRVSLMRHEIEAVLPLQAGALHENRSYRFVVDRVDRTATGVAVVGRETHAFSIFGRRVRPSFEFYVRSRRVREAVNGGQYRPTGFHLVNRLNPFGDVHVEASPAFLVRDLTMHVPPLYGRPEERVVLDDRWIADAELVVVRITPDGSVVRTLDIPRFSLRAEDGSSAAAGRSP
jgi:hypothetical protein